MICLFSLIETYVSFNHFKDRNLHYKMKYKTKLRDIFLLIFNGYSMIYDNFGGNRDCLKQNLALQFCKNRNKDVSILTETHIVLDKIHDIKIIGLVQSFSLLEVVTQNDCLFCIICVLKMSLRLTLTLKGGFCPLGLLPLMTAFSVFMSSVLHQ